MFSATLRAWRGCPRRFAAAVGWGIRAASGASGGGWWGGGTFSAYEYSTDGGPVYVVLQNLLLYQCPDWAHLLITCFVLATLGNVNVDPTRVDAAMAASWQGRLWQGRLGGLHAVDSPPQERRVGRESL